MKKALSTFRVIQLSSAVILAVGAIVLLIGNPSDRLAGVLLRGILPVCGITFLYETFMKKRFGSRITENLH
ncbi:MAG: hypothetical protein EOO05_11580 [Chitinophagaceae bacterium]|nr:MAG: hypothetical protein EOO05_11580 [Chitinophagaceae bacterium]